MATRYITLKKTDAAFHQYLSGSVDLSFRPIPVKSYNIGTADEAITFELVPTQTQKSATVPALIFRLVKPKTFVLALFPFFYVFFSALGYKGFDFLYTFLATLAALALLSALNIRNDVVDHYSGFDRVNVEAKPKPIARGWISAEKAQKISNLFLLAALILALPVIWKYPMVLGIVAVSGFLFFIGRLLQKNSYKNQHFGELSLFLLSGPAYFAGLYWAGGTPFILKNVIFSFVWGLGVLFLIQVNNFSHIMTSSQNQIQNTMTKLGFDRAQTYLVFHWLVFVFSWSVFHIYQRDFAVSGAFIFILAILSVHFFYRIKRIRSPMGSGLFRIRKQAYRIFSVMVLFSSILIAWPTLWYLIMPLLTGQP